MSFILNLLRFIIQSIMKGKRVRKVKILFLMLLGVLGLNCCFALATTGAITYFGRTMLEYGYAENPNFCNPFLEKSKTPE